MLYTQICVHSSIIWNNEKLEKMSCIAQLLKSVLCSHERKCLKMENAYVIILWTKQDTKLNIQNEYSSVKTQQSID